MYPIKINTYFAATNQLFMTRILLTLLLFIQAITLSAQKIEEGFDYAFKPTNNVARYYVITEQKDSLWHRKAYYLPERGMAMEGWYKDKNCKKPHGTVTWYHSNRTLKSYGAYVNGKKEGVWLTYNEEGRLTDSATYAAGRLKGIRLRWHNDMLVDSSQFDGEGNGVQVTWYEDGNPASAGYWTSDTTKKGRWEYFHPNGKLKATEKYVFGNRVSCECFDEAGNQLDSATCSREREAEFPGGLQGWARYLQRSLNHNKPIQNNAPAGAYTVILQFIIDTDGSIIDIRPLTKYGYGMEEEVERVLRKGPKWIPAEQFGAKVKAYRKQPVTFVVSGRN